MLLLLCNTSQLQRYSFHTPTLTLFLCFLLLSLRTTHPVLLLFPTPHHYHVFSFYTTHLACLCVLSDVLAPPPTHVYVNLQHAFSSAALKTQRLLHFVCIVTLSRMSSSRSLSASLRSADKPVTSNERHAKLFASSVKLSDPRSQSV